MHDCHVIILLCGLMLTSCNRLKQLLFNNSPNRAMKTTDDTEKGLFKIKKNSVFLVSVL